MATKKSAPPEVIPLADEGTQRPRLHRLVIQNFRSIGKQPLEVELDDVVVLVGPNNAGKSSILHAYEVVMSQGSKDGRLGIDDFPNGVVSPECPPTIELQTIVYHNAPGERWIQETANGEWLIRERWIWDSPNKDPVRQGFDVRVNDWSEQVPWGAPNVANSMRPQAHRIDAFAAPDLQAQEIASLLTSLLKTKLTTIKSDPACERSDYELVLDKIRDLQSRAVVETEQEVRTIEKEISQYLEKIFPKHRVKLDAKAETDIDKTYSPFKANPSVLMGADGGYFSSISHQGSGARRTLLWATLKYLSESKDKTSGRPHVLLLDEPEICLHPSAVREARAVLYSLPSSGNWQVMITSHSPIFIDLSRDNTTIVRVFRDETSEVRSTTLFRPQRARLSEDDKRNLKLLNVCDPYLHEFFFGGRQVVVEGDTEYTAFAMLKEYFPGQYDDVQVIRARGKGIIPSVARVLLQFSKDFSVLHDADSPTTAAGKQNPAWGMNRSIADIRASDDAKAAVSLVACKPCFEAAMFGKEVSNEKPYNALRHIREDGDARLRVKALLDCLLDKGQEAPAGCVRWESLDQLVG